MPTDSRLAILERGDRILVAPDKFRSSASAAQLREVMAHAVADAGYRALPVAISDGGEGLLEALGGDPRGNVVTGPLGKPVLAEWRMRKEPDGAMTAIIEMARASGISLVGEVTSNEPVRADSRGTGELIAHAIDEGATTIIVGCGGSATTDGGAGALEVLEGVLPRPGVRLVVACDVTTLFVDAAPVFAPQKGATPVQVIELRERLVGLEATYRSRFGIDLRNVSRAGAAGGLAGGLFVIGGELVSGIDLVAREIDLDRLIGSCRLVLSGEGRLDATSLTGKVVGDLIDRTRGVVPLVLIVGEALIEIDRQRHADLEIVSLVERFGKDRSMHETLGCVSTATSDALAPFAPDHLR